jgi:hypothetical protein
MATANQRASRKQEGRITKTFKQIAEETRQAIASGALWFQKSDVISESFRIECKTKVKASTQMTIKKEWLEKISEEAFQTGKIGLLAFSFGDNKDYLAIESKEFIVLMEELKELREKVKVYEKDTDNKV